VTSSAPAGFKRPRRGGSSQSFLSDYLQGFFGSQNQPKMTPVATQPAPAQGETSGGFQIINPTTMMESSGFVSPASNITSLGRPSSVAGNLQIDYQSLGGNSVLPKATITGPTSFSDYNAAAKSLYEQTYGKPWGGFQSETGHGFNRRYPSSVAMSNLQAGLPVDLNQMVTDTMKRTGMSAEDAQKRVNTRVGGYLYQQGVKQGYYEPGTYLRQGQKYNIMG
jgi:hypothetical protein